MEATQETAPTTEINFFVISKSKLAIMWIATFGIYDIYWFYKNWKAVQVVNPKVKYPFWRAVFSIFYCFPFFKLVEDKAATAKYPKRIPSTVLALLYAILLLSGNFWGRASITNRWLDLGFFVITSLGFIPLLYIQDALNFMHTKDMNAQVKVKYSALATIVATLGMLIVILAILGTVLPE